MKYYELALCGLYLENLIFHSEESLYPLNEVLVSLNVKKKEYFNLFEKGNSKLIRAVVIKECQKPHFETSPILQILPSSLSILQFELARFISYYYGGKLGFILGFFQGCKPYECVKLEKFPQPNLSPDQQEALNFLKSQSNSLLFADTGSGKTEIYITLIKEYLEQGKQVLLLMPEIALSSQMQKRLQVYFKDNFFLWHSKISKKRKAQALEKFTNAESLLVAGARSALFLPFRNLGLIIVDEEHDNSYKASNKPYFNVRDLSLFLGKKFDIKVILGSATPSLTSFYRQKFFRLKGTFFESKKCFLYDESELAVTPFLLHELELSLKKKKQAIVFLPTRANFRQVFCKHCASTINCPRCSVAMSLHKHKRVLKCHYCNYIKKIDTFCPNCKGVLLEARKMGTAELKERLENALPQAKIVKFDSDEISSVKKLDTILEAFNAKEIDILVGTSMLAKGHDYHNVDLSVILGLDEYLFRPDFRAAEETLALAMQVAGRAGRKGEARVLLQTNNRSFFQKYIQNYDLFLKDELEFRKDLYPPFKRLLRMIIEHKDPAFAFGLCEELVKALKNTPDLELVGYGACGIEMLYSKHRFYVLWRSYSYKSLLFAQNFVSTFKDVSTDIDPIDFS
ncbi:primosomal protein N' [Campylobacter sp. MIT 21-1685]|uniref:primosomal protein N' n=1 Tax=unclassified Campylobacter TaxID=2593542 RepID=UPI00224AD5B0|nr:MULTISPECIES: primosomal protein N' [unclassified Campylobacter]MCX2682339.1 primosomal protein N' [Campylobacter sp. MIT 21-1684]MCX2750619.1 primosomal protein N' [Campylobacter sp. MIT 21-1682]MCX2806833.1 primosomal protein N' [Campylobacter sp. MIT 21-1685]